MSVVYEILEKFQFHGRKSSCFHCIVCTIHTIVIETYKNVYCARHIVMETYKNADSIVALLFLRSLNDYLILVYDCTKDIFVNQMNRIQFIIQSEIIRDIILILGGYALIGNCLTSYRGVRYHS